MYMCKCKCTRHMQVPRGGVAWTGEEGAPGGPWPGPASGLPCPEVTVHEWLKEHGGEGSRWGPYLRTLRSPALGRATLRAMAGTYASEVHAEYRADATRAASEIQYSFCLQASDMCARQPGEVGSGTHTRDEFRWALGVVRSRAVWVRKRTTGAAFLALVPFLDLLPHHPRAGGDGDGHHQGGARGLSLIHI